MGLKGNSDLGKYYYKIYGLTLASDYEFPQFVSIDAVEDADIEMEYGGISEEIMSQISNGVYGGLRKNEIWFDNHVGIFWIHDLKKINFVESGASIDDAAQYLPGLCLAILLWYRKMIMLHGACLRLNGKTIIVAGDSGSGKSTITTELIKKGAFLMADDVTGIGVDNGTYISYPAFPFQKLCTDQIEKNCIDTTGLRQIRYDLNKFEIPRVDTFWDNPEKADILFRIEVSDVDSFTAEEITGAEKIKIITNSIFINWLFVGDFKLEPDDLMRCINFANQIKTHKICRNKEKNTINEILDYIINNV